MTLIDFLRTAAYIIIFGALWRVIQIKAAGTKLGAAMSIIY